jgi:hypothetical protein
MILRIFLQYVLGLEVRQRGLRLGIDLWYPSAAARDY